jgi:hypothetical protein
MAQGDAQHLEGQDPVERFEIAAGDDALLFEENAGIVVGAVEMRLQKPSRVGEGVPDGAVHLRRATDAQGILEGPCHVGLPQITPLQKSPGQLHAPPLSRIGAPGVRPRIEGRDVPLEALHGHGVGQVRRGR